jgi:hypothetical protein
MYSTPNPTIADPTDQCSYGTRVQRRFEQLDSWKGIQTKKALQAYEQRSSTLDDGAIASLHDIFNLAEGCLTGKVQPGSSLSQ